MENKKIEKLFEQQQEAFDFEEPISGHQQRFLNKLKQTERILTIDKKNKSWWKPLSIAASVLALCTTALALYNSEGLNYNGVSEVSSEMSNTQFYFTNIIEEQVKQLKSQSAPETKKVVDDAMVQLNNLAADYSIIENDLLNGGNSKMLLSAMIINFQTRIDLLQVVLEQLETIKKLKNQNNENNIL